MELADSTRDLRVEAEASVAAATSFTALADFERSDALFERAIRAYGRIPELTELAHIRLRFGMLLNYRGLDDRAEDQIRRAIELADTVGNWRLGVHARQVLMYVRRIRGDLDEAERLLDWVTTTGERYGDRHALATALTQFGALELTARIEEREATLTRASTIFAELDDDESWAVARTNLGDLRLAQGRADEARTIYLHEAAPALERQGQHGRLAAVLARIARIHAAQGERRRALRILRDEVLPTYERLHDHVSALQTRLSIAGLLEPDEALAQIEQDILPRARSLGAAHILRAAEQLEAELRAPKALA